MTHVDLYLRPRKLHALKSQGLGQAAHPLKAI